MSNEDVGILVFGTECLTPCRCSEPGNVSLCWTLELQRDISECRDPGSWFFKLAVSVSVLDKCCYVFLSLHKTKVYLE